MILAGGERKGWQLSILTWKRKKATIKSFSFPHVQGKEDQITEKTILLLKPEDTFDAVFLLLSPCYFIIVVISPLLPHLRTIAAPCVRRRLSPTSHAEGGFCMGNPPSASAYFSSHVRLTDGQTIRQTDRQTDRVQNCVAKDNEQKKLCRNRR